MKRHFDGVVRLFAVFGFGAALVVAPLSSSQALVPGYDDGGGGGVGGGWIGGGWSGGGGGGDGGGGGGGGGGSCDNANPVGNWSKSVSKSDSFGNSKFGASYELAASISAKSGTANNIPTDKLDADAHAKANVTVFSKTKEVFKAQAQAHSNYGQSASASAGVYVLGKAVWTKSWTGKLNKTWQTPTQTFFSATAHFWVGPVPVSVSASAKGYAGITISGGLLSSGIGITAKPFGKVWATGSAGVNVIIAGLGVAVDLTLADLKVPATATLKLAGRCLEWALKVAADLDMMAGKFYVWVKVKLLFVKKKFTKTLFSWNGWHKNWTLFNKSGYIPLL